MTMIHVACMMYRIVYKYMCMAMSPSPVRLFRFSDVSCELCGVLLLDVGADMHHPSCCRPVVGTTIL